MRYTEKHRNIVNVPAFGRETLFPLAIRSTFYLVLPCLLVLSSTGCKMGPKYRQPEVAAPSGWRNAHAEGGSAAHLEWWQFYRDPLLTNLIATAVEQNHDLRIAAGRIEQAQGTYRSQRSLLFPSVDAAGGWTRGRSGYTQLTGNQFEILGLLSYEVDIWGRVRRLTESARAELLATRYARDTVQITLIANVANAYFNLRALDEQLAIARRTLASRTNSLELTKTKFNDGNGVVSELDVRQAETQVFSAQSSIAQIERAIALNENLISFLLGNNPGSIARDLDGAPSPAPGEIPAGLPSELLFRRPDIHEAEELLIAANANIGAARAAYFPTISLTAALGLQSVELNDLFDAGTSKAWSFAPRLATPIFNAGRIRAGVQVARGQQQVALAAYEQAIRNAFREVDDALVSVAKLREQTAAEEANVQAERKRLELSYDRYEAGIASYLEVLDAERSLFGTELSLAQTRGDLLAAAAQLYKALGGGWETVPMEKPSSR